MQQVLFLFGVSLMLVSLLPQFFHLHCLCLLPSGLLFLQFPLNLSHLRWRLLPECFYLRSLLYYCWLSLLQFLLSLPVLHVRLLPVSIHLPLLFRHYKLLRLQ